MLRRLKKGNSDGHKRNRDCRSHYHLGCGWHVVLRGRTCAKDEQHANATSGNDASRHAPGNIARDASDATSKALEPCS
jgi:hypothetical protein